MDHDYEHLIFCEKKFIMVDGKHCWTLRIDHCCSNFCFLIFLTVVVTLD